MEDDRYYLVLMEEELALCHVLGATRVCAGAVRWMDGWLPTSAVPRRGCGSLSKLPGGASADPLGPFWWRRGPSAAPFVDCRASFIRSTMCQWYQAPAGLVTRSALFRQDWECSIAVEAFYLEPWRKRFQAVDIIRTFSYTSGLDEEWKSSAVVHNLMSVQNEVEPYVNAASKMFIAACAAVIGVMILFGTLLVLAIRRFRNCSSAGQANPAPS